jgi:hypothetical protein
MMTYSQATARNVQNQNAVKKARPTVKPKVTVIGWFRSFQGVSGGGWTECAL